jgi:predicted phage terminase large subunit-like protein
MLQVPQTRIVREAISSPLAVEEYGLRELLEARASFWEYRIAMNPRFVLRGKWFPRSLARKLRTFWDDYKAGKRPVLLLETPPQHGKSLSVIDFIAWAVGHDPHLRVIYTSFSDRLSIRANLRMQRALDNPTYQRIFPETRIAPKGSGEALRNYDILEFLDTDGEGYFRNSTVLGSITGEALDIGVVDDPIKGRIEANSLNNRDKVWMWLTDDVFPRFSDQAGLLMIMTRWHLDDPAGRLIEHFGDRATIARYPAIAEHDEQYRKAGEPLFPELKSLEFLEQRRKAMTLGSWEALYQQSPIVVGGGIFPIEKIGYVSERPAAKDVVSAARYWDKAGTKEGGAYSAGVLMLRMRDGTFVVADARRGQWSALDRERVIRQTAEVDRKLYPLTKIYLEQEPGSGGKESAEASVRMLAGFSVEADRVSGPKEVRADPFAAQWQAGNVWLVAAQWNRDYLDEHEHFPAGKYKDQVDASTGAFNKIASKYRYDSTLSWVS